MEKATLIDRLKGMSVNRITKVDEYKNVSNESREYLFVQQFLEKPVYSGDVKMLTLPTASTWRGVPVLDDW